MTDRKGVGGRPTTYTDEIANAICQWIAEGNSLRSFVDNHSDSPARSTITLWIVNKPEFSAQYQRAREAAGFSHADDILEVAGEIRSGSLEPQAAKVIIDAQKWSAERMSPKNHSPRQEVTGPEGGPVEADVKMDWAQLDLETLKKVKAASGAATDAS